jgi:hypothetical protein
MVCDRTLAENINEAESESLCANAPDVGASIAATGSDITPAPYDVHNFVAAQQKTY